MTDLTWGLREFSSPPEPINTDITPDLTATESEGVNHPSYSDVTGRPSRPTTTLALPTPLPQRPPRQTKNNLRNIKRTSNNPATENPPAQPLTKKTPTILKPIKGGQQPANSKSSRPTDDPTAWVTVQSRKKRSTGRKIISDAELMNTRVTDDIKNLIKTLPNRVVSSPDETEPIDTYVSPNIHRSVLFKGNELDDAPARLPNSTATVWKQAKTCMMTAMRADVRADWLQSLNEAAIITHWAAGKADLPQYVAEDDLLQKIVEVRRNAAVEVQRLTANYLQTKAEGERKQGHTLLATTDQLSADDPEAFENAISVTCGMVDRAKALLIKDLSAKREILHSTQLTLTQWAYIARAPNSTQVGQNPLAPRNTNMDRNGRQMRNAPKRQRNNFGLFHATDTRQTDSRQGGNSNQIFGGARPRREQRSRSREGRRPRPVYGAPGPYNSNRQRRMDSPQYRPTPQNTSNLMERELALVRAFRRPE